MNENLLVPLSDGILSFRLRPFEKRIRELLDEIIFSRGSSTAVTPIPRIKTA
jgi:hypothetical protein